MNKRLIILGLIILAAAVVLKLVYVGLKNIKVDDFHPAAVMIVVDSSASNQKNLPEQTKYIKQLCGLLDPEDQIKILKVSEKSYLIYEGSPMDSSGISKAMNAFTKYDENDYGTAYGEALKKAFNHCLTMKKEGYIPAVVVVGDLENEGKVENQINWDTLPANVKKLQEYIPELSMMFVYAHPEKLDLVKTKLTPVLGETKLVIANEQAVNKASTRFLKAIGR
ncbi:MAG: hypothetical protein DKM22_07675 [Candidatus Melainabacteria bacterium]|nr:MAG: hypothetical protein DKM22_07675 [Candidatus Melainabacteria bacterium]